MAPNTAKPKLLIIAGPTASGKSALAMRLAKKLHGEIISADSWTVYKGFDIGTGKPSKSDQSAVRHHLIDVRDAGEGFNAKLFKELASAAIEEIRDRGNLPILVGGTGLYIDSVLHDFGFLPVGAPGVRGDLEKMELADLLILAQKRRIDVSGIDTRNKRRVIRALETGGQKPSKNEIGPGNLVVGIRFDRDSLKINIEARVRAMINDGLEAEVRRLAGKYGWEAEPMKGIGYLQWREYFEATQTLDQTIDRIVSASLGLAKRQRTWFKNKPYIHWFEDANQAYKFILSVTE